MTGAEVRRSRTVAVPAERAWAVVTDVRRHERWIPLTRIDAAPILAVGDSFVGVSGPGATRGLPGLADHMTLDRLDPPDGRTTGVAVYRKTGPVLLGEAEVQVRPLGAGHSQITWVERVHLRGPRWADAWWPRLTAPLVAVPLALMLRLVLHRAAAELEGR